MFLVALALRVTFKAQGHFIGPSQKIDALDRVEGHKGAIRLFKSRFSATFATWWPILKATRITMADSYQADLSMKRLVDCSYEIKGVPRCVVWKKG
jgi:hypothetical protein